MEGLHFHTLCEQLFEPLERTARVFEEKFGEFLPQMKWLNLGGGHHITREGYDIDALVEAGRATSGRSTSVEVYLEPGEAIAIGTGILVSEVLDMIAQRDGYRHPGRLGHLPHARHPGDALPPGDRGGLRPRRKASHLPAGRAVLPGRAT